MQKSQFKYFCYNCSKNFNSQYQLYSCSLCDCNAIQLINSQQQQNKSQKFTVFQIKNNNAYIQPIGMLQNCVGPRGNSVTRTVVSIVSTSHDISDIAQGSYLGNLLRQLLRDGDRMTPATQQQIQKLEKLKKIKQCSICQDAEQQEENMEESVIQSTQSTTEGFRLSCHHTFHEQCIRPWFQRTNTCPACRKSIQTQ